jgi:hypothetical protein
LVAHIQLIAALIIAQILILSSRGQGTFRNLGFEEALIAPGTPEGKVSGDLAIPGWNAFLDEGRLSEISYQQFEPFRSDITIFDRASGVNTLDGRYSVSLFSVGIGNCSIRQTGVVPQGATYLLFKLNPRNQDPVPPDISIEPTIRMNGEVLNYSGLVFASSYALYSAEISRFARQSVTLEFAAVRPPRGVSSFILESIEFSNIPEPNILSIFLIALSMLCRIMFRKER